MTEMHLHTQYWTQFVSVLKYNEILALYAYRKVTTNDHNWEW